jgi:hypothetical protein
MTNKLIMEGGDNSMPCSLETSMARAAEAMSLAMAEKTFVDMALAGVLRKGEKSKDCGSAAGSNSVV